METPASSMLFANRISLETFLVEWKLYIQGKIWKKIRNLETFLVEWKPFSWRAPFVPLGSLETFLVEWKQIEG